MNSHDNIFAWFYWFYAWNVFVNLCYFEFLDNSIALLVTACFAASQPYKDEQPSYVPSEMVGSFGPADAGVSYHCYLIELKQDFGYDVPIHDLVLCMRSALESDLANIHFDLQVGRGSVTVNLKNVGTLSLNRDQVRALVLIITKKEKKKKKEELLCFVAYAVVHLLDILDKLTGSLVCKYF